MAVFYILLLVPILIQHITVKNYPIGYQKKNKAVLSFFFCMLTVLLMFRHKSVGSDTNHYMQIFSRFSKLEWEHLASTHYEIGFAVFNKVISVFSKKPQVFISVAAIAVSLMIYPTYKRLCVDPSLTIVLYCTMSTFVMMFSGIRQMLAIGIAFLAYECVRKHKLLLFLLLALLAMSFHTSGFMLLFMYPLYHAHITRKWLYVMIPAMVLVFVLNRPIFSVLAALLERYTQYDGSISSTGAYTMLILFLAFSAFSFLIPDESSMDRETVGLRNFLLLALVLQMFAPLHTLAMRMNYYYIIFIPLLIPRIIAYRSVRWRQVATLGRHTMVVFFLVYFFIYAYGGNNLHVFPYHFFWENLG